MTAAVDLLAALSTREKIGQLNQRLYGWECVRKTPTGYELTDTLHEELARWSGLGALYGLFRSDAWSGRGWHNGIPPEDRAEVAALVQEAVRATSPHGTGALLVEEAPHGHQALGAPLLPVNLATAASWRPDLLRDASAAVSGLLRADGVHLALVSTLDLLRDPRWGRSEECFGESPVLAAALTEAVVQGMQGHDRERLDDGTGVGVVLKHFAAQGDGMGGRNGQSAPIGPRELAELHLVPARAGIAAGAIGLMSAYTDIDGVPCCADEGLLTGTLRDEWGFDGLVMADGKAVDRLVEHLGSHAAAGAAAVAAGVDLSLWDESFAALTEAVERLPELEAAIDRACLRVLRAKERFGLLGGPGGHSEPLREAEAAAGTDRAGLDIAARTASAELARASIVLLEDAEGVLPPKPGAERVWAVVGPNADSVTALLGDYVPPLPPGAGRSILTALRERAGQDGIEVVTAPWPADGVPGEDLRAAVGRADRVIAVLGGTSHRHFDDSFADNGAAAGPTTADTGEGVDRASLMLPGDQDTALAAVRALTRAPTVSVVVTGRPSVLTGIVAVSDATLFCAYPGPEGADAVAAVLCGDRRPTGRLAVALPAHPGAVPAHGDDRHCAADVYRDAPRPVLFPLGHGLGGAAMVRAASADEDAVRVELEGGRESAEELVLVFAQRRGSVVVPRREELIAFGRVVVPPGERRSLTLPLSAGVFVPVGERAPLADIATDLTIVVGAQRRTLTIRPGKDRQP